MYDVPLDDVIKRYPVLTACRTNIEAAVTIMIQSFQNGGKLLLCGNGGSAADAEHWSGELLKGFCSRRVLTENEKETLSPKLVDKLQGGLPAIPLNGFLSLSSAFANDVDPELVYAQLVWSLGNDKDVLVGISTSGNAKNILSAFEVAKAKGLMTVALTGECGGKLSQSGWCDICIKVPQTKTYLVQELHLPVYHAICLLLEQHFFNQ